MQKNSRIVVTGARGLVGSALVDQLAGEGYSEVIGLGREDCDLMDGAATRRVLAELRPEYLFHSAARVYGIMGNMKNQALSFYENNIINTNVVDAAHRAGARKITVMGTGAIYPYPSPGLPLKEDMIFLGEPHIAESGYANAKRAMLAMLKAYQESFGLQWAYVVSCNLFGPRDKFDVEFGHVVPSLVSKFYEAKTKGTSVSVWGDGSAQRDFLYVKDAARAGLAIMKGIEGCANIGSGEVLRIRDIVDMLCDITDMHGRVIWDASKPNGQDYRAYDLSRLKSVGFQTDYTIREGLEETWNWFSERERSHASVTT